MPAALVTNLLPNSIQDSDFNLESSKWTKAFQNKEFLLDVEVHWEPVEECEGSHSVIGVVGEVDDFGRRVLLLLFLFFITPSMYVVLYKT